MANYHLNMSYGKTGKGVPHISYILGQNKYDYKADEVLYSNSHMPDWAKDQKEFWEAADQYERVNGRIYREIRLSLPNELSNKENIELLNTFIKKELGENYYYSVVIHDKENQINSKYDNIHAHLMFCPRKLDGIKRDKKTFFKRANQFTPEKGGCKKDEIWNTKEKLFQIRKDWELIQNHFLEKNGFDIRVSSDSLKKQREEALKKGDLLKAELLDREPINLEKDLLQKAKKTPDKLEPEEEIIIEEFIRNRQIKELKEELYQLNLEKEKLQKDKENIKELEKNIDLIELCDTINMLDIEISKKEFEQFYNIENLAADKIVPEYTYLLAQIDKLYSELDSDPNLTENQQQKILEKISNLENKLNAAKEILETNKEQLAKEKEYIYESYENEITKLKLSRLHHIDRLKEYSQTDKENFENVHKKLEKDFKDNFINIIEYSVRLKQVQKELNKLKDYEANEKLEETAINIITKGEYKKITKEYNRLAAEIEFLTNNLNHNLLKENDKKIALQKLKILNEKFSEIQSKKHKLDDELSTPEKLSKKIKIIESIKKKMELRKKKYISEEFILKSKIELLKEKLINSNYTQEEYNNILKIFSNSINLKEKELEKIILQKNAYSKYMSESMIQRLAYNKLTGGMYLKLINLYSKKQKLLENKKAELDKLSMFDLKAKNKLKQEIRDLEKECNKIEEDFKKLRSTINEKELMKTIIELTEIKKKTLNKLENMENTARSNLFKEKYKIKIAKELKDCVKPLEINKLKKHMSLQRIGLRNFINTYEQGSTYGSFSLDLEEEKNKNVLEL